MGIDDTECPYRDKLPSNNTNSNSKSVLMLQVEQTVQQVMMKAMAEEMVYTYWQMLMTKYGTGRHKSRLYIMHSNQVNIMCSTSLQQHAGDIAKPLSSPTFQSLE